MSRGAALADLHLGVRQFQATVDGRNTREVDTESAWYAAISAIISEKVDLVTIAGDVFHHPRVSDYAKKAFLVGIRTLLESGAEVIVLQGNHDAGRTADVLPPIRLAEAPRLHVITEPSWVPFVTEGGEEVVVSCYPYTALQDLPAYKLEPNPTADVNILLMHAAVKGSAEGDKTPFFYGSSDQALDVGREIDRWSAILVGDFHEFTRLHPERLAFYSGSLERTSNNIWQEQAPKGWVLYDTATGKMELQEVPTREMLDWSLGDLRIEGNSVSGVATTPKK